MYHLLCLRGSLEGKTLPLKKRTVLGRSDADILLEDSLISDSHAELRLSGKNKIILVDLDSKNGTFVDDEEITQVSLQEGSTFCLGNHEFQIVTIKKADDILSEFLEKARDRVENLSQKLYPLPKPLKVIFVSGAQKNQEYILAYGPRHFGSTSIDFPILDPQSPPHAFSLLASEGTIFFETPAPDRVQLNDKKLKKQALDQEGYVSIGDTKIHISFVK